MKKKTETKLYYVLIYLEGDDIFGSLVTAENSGQACIKAYKKFDESHPCNFYDYDEYDYLVALATKDKKTKTTDLSLTHHRFIEGVQIDEIYF